MEDSYFLETSAALTNRIWDVLAVKGETRLGNRDHFQAKHNLELLSSRAEFKSRRFSVNRL